MKLKNTDVLEVADRKLKVNGRDFIIRYPDEPILRTEDGKLETIVFKACGYTSTLWEPEEIDGYFADQEMENNTDSD